MLMSQVRQELRFTFGIDCVAVIHDLHKELFQCTIENENHIGELESMGREELETAVDDPLEGFTACFHAAGNGQYTQKNGEFRREHKECL